MNRNINNYSDEYRIDYEREIKRAKRRKKLLEERRKKQQRIRKIKRIAASAAAIIVLSTAGVASIYMSKDTAQTESSYSPKETLEVAADINSASNISKNLYPAISPVYSEIDSEDIKSPYIALLDVENNSLIAGRNSDQMIYPASMTKVMTLIVAVENIGDTNSTYTMSAPMISSLVAQEASRAGFDPDETVSFNDLLYGLILPSGADSAVALAEMVGGTEEGFAQLMNKKCEELGLKDTHFVNASGLFDENQYTTPLEMAMIMKYAMSNETCAKILSTYQYTTAPTPQHPEGIALTSTMFSRMYGTEVEGVTITAGKTGYTDEAKSCLVSYAEKDEHHYVAVTAAADYKWHVIFDDFEIYGNYLPQQPA